MIKFTQTCGACVGMGTIDHWKVSEEFSEDGIGYAQREVKTCENCGGRGRTEHDLLTAEDLKDLSNDISFLANILWETVMRDGWMPNVSFVCNRLKEIEEKYKELTE